MEKAYKFRLYPTAKQEELIRKTIGCSRFVYNQTLAARKGAHPPKGWPRPFMSSFIAARRPLSLSESPKQKTVPGFIVPRGPLALVEIQGRKPYRVEPVLDHGSWRTMRFLY